MDVDKWPFHWQTERVLWRKAQGNKAQSFKHDNGFPYRKGFNKEECEGKGLSLLLKLTQAQHKKENQK